MNLSEAEAEMRRLSDLIDKGTSEMVAQVRKNAEAERDYRKGRAEAWALSSGELAATKDDGEKVLAKEREDWVDATTADLRYVRDLADGMVRAAHEASRNRRAQLSMLQTLVNAERSLADFDRTGPR